ncbi:MAG: hypothetical protein ACLQJL_16865, partial [Roseiarcus sp.]
KEELDRRTASLQDEIARVRAERRLADGALEASRTERQRARRGGPALDDAHRDAGEAMAPAKTVESPAPQGNVTKLPRSA